MASLQIRTVPLYQDGLRVWTSALGATLRCLSWVFPNDLALTTPHLPYSTSMPPYLSRCAKTAGGTGEQAFFSLAPG